MVGWVLFRAETLPQAFAFLKAMVGIEGTATGAGAWYRPEMYVNAQVWIAIIAGVIGSAPIWPRIGQWTDYFVHSLRGRAQVACEASILAIAFVALTSVLVIAGLLVAAGTYSPFIYFRF